jgi:hypothetical protein
LRRRRGGGLVLPSGPSTTWTTVLLLLLWLKVLLRLDVLLLLLRMLPGVVGGEPSERVLDEVQDGDVDAVDDVGEALLRVDCHDSQDEMLLLIVRLRDWRRDVLSGFRASEANGVCGRSNATNILRSGVLRLTVHVCISLWIIDWSLEISPSAAILEYILGCKIGKGLTCEKNKSRDHDMVSWTC